MVHSLAHMRKETGEEEIKEPVLNGGNVQWHRCRETTEKDKEKNKQTEENR